MAEQSEVLSGSDIGAVYRRRKMPMLKTIAITLLLSSYFAFTPQSTYRSTAHIQIERQEIPRNLVTSGDRGYGADEIEASTLQVMMSENLLPIATSLDLYAENGKSLSPEKQVAKLSANINISTIIEERVHPRTGRPLLEATAFKISFDHYSPVKAQQVAAILAELYLNINHQRRTERASGTSAFLAREAERLNQEVSKLEQRLSEFKEQNTYLLPEYAGYNFQLIERTNTEIERQKALINSLLEKRALLGSQLIAGEPIIDPLDTARIELAEAQQKYTQQHPRVLMLKRAVESLEHQAKNPGKQISNTPTYSYKESVANARLKAQRQTIDSDLIAARTQLAELESKIQNYESRLARSPEVERKYLAVSRNYENALNKYTELKDKEMQARLSEELERAQKGDRFRLIRAPAIPDHPIGPNRIGIMSLGLAISLLGSFILASFLEYVDPTVRGAEGINAVLHAPPLGVVPYISN